MLKPQMHNTLLSLSTTFIADARVRLGLPESHLDPSIRPVVPFSRMVGTAVTVLLEVADDEASADLRPLVAAYEAQSPDSISIMAIQVPPELHSNGIFGDGAALLARRHGFAGAVVDGAVRDTHELSKMEFPVFSRTITPGYIVGKCSTTSVAEPVVIGGRTIHQGDVIVADNDGVIVIRPEELDEVVKRAQAIKEWEEKVHNASSEGKSREEVMRIAGPMP